MTKSKKLKYQEAGRCPKCGNHNLEFGMSYPEGEDIYYEIVCNDCKFSGKEWYTLTYAETTAD